jgi:hypothetical protein
VLKKQQEDLQKELERRSDEMRKKLESGAPTGGAPTASAPAPAPRLEVASHGARSRAYSRQRRAESPAFLVPASDQA